MKETQINFSLPWFSARLITQKDILGRSVTPGVTGKKT
jgi:hypothetical protein